MDGIENVATFGGGATVVTSDPSVAWPAFGNGQLKQTKNGNSSQLGALLASGGQNNQNNNAPVIQVFLVIIMLALNDVLYSLY